MSTVLCDSFGQLSMNFLYSIFFITFIDLSRKQMNPANKLAGRNNVSMLFQQ